MMRVPGLDWLTPSVLDAGAALVVEDSALTIGVCLPPAFRAVNANASTRPGRFPGTQALTGSMPQTDCINMSNTEPSMTLRRCWADLSLVVDMAFPGMDPNPSGVPTPNHYDVLVLRTWTLCDVLVTRECVQNGDPISCMLLAREKTLPAAAAAAPSDVRGPSSDDGTGVALPLALSVGGAALLAAVVLGAVWWWRRSRTPPSSLKLELATSNSSPMGGSLICSTTAATNGPKGKDPDADPNPATTGCLSSTRRTFSQNNSETEYGLTLDQEDPTANRSLPARCTGVVTPETPLGASLNLNIQMAYGGTTSALFPITTHEPGMAVLLGGECRVAVEGECGAHFRASPAAAAAPTAAGAGGSKALSSPLKPGEDCPSASTASASEVAVEAPKDVVELLPTVLGKGSFGRVVEGIYRGERVAVKHLSEEQDMWGACGSSESSLQRALTQEVEVLGRCRHPNIVRLIAASVQPPRLGLVMELMETSLYRMMYDKGPEARLLPLGLVLHIATEVARGLEYLHPTIVHRDLKPANVLINTPLGGKPIVKLADFGLSRLRRTVVPTATACAGTPAYMAPECFDVRNNIITHQADIYSFGVLLWEMLNCKQPWERLDPLHLAVRVVVRNERLPLPPESDPRQGRRHLWPPKLRRLLQQCWEADPKRRPAAAEVVKTLLLVAQALPPSELSFGADT